MILDPKPVDSLGHLRFYFIMLGLINHNMLKKKKISISLLLFFSDEKRKDCIYLQEKNHKPCPASIGPTGRILPKSKSRNKPPIFTWCYLFWVFFFIVFNQIFYSCDPTGYLQHTFPLWSWGTFSPAISNWTSVLSTPWNWLVYWIQYIEYIQNLLYWIWLIYWIQFLKQLYHDFCENTFDV